MLKLKKSSAFLCLILLFGLGGTEALAQQLAAAIFSGDLPRYRQAHEAFESIIRSGGFNDEKLKIFTQTPNPDEMSLTNSVRRSIAAGADLIITYGAPATLAALQETKEVPILFADVYDPVALGIVQTLSAPGVNRSGASSKVPMGPLLQALQQTMPGGKRLGALYTSGEAGSAKQIEDLGNAAKAMGFKVLPENVPSGKALDGALRNLSGKIDVLFLSECYAATSQAREIIAFAMQNKLPVISQTPGLVRDGALMCFTPDPDEQGKLVAVHALQLLSGQKAFFLPVREAKRVSLSVNLKSAAELSLKIPATVLEQAEKIPQ